MISIERFYNQYQMQFKSGYPRARWALKVLADDLEEVHTAIDHYYGKKHDKTGCPLCKRK